MKIPKVAVINDLSGLGKCSLTAAIPILSSMGVQACPLATGVLSNQTGFPSFSCTDLTATLEPFANEWEKRNVEFASIFTGFLCDVSQINFIERLVGRFRRTDTIVLVDPVLGDGGERYSAISQKLCDSMKSLVTMADVITPNFTEACFLTDSKEYHPDSLEQAWEMAQMLVELGPKTVVVTGLHQKDGVANVMYQKNGTKLSVCSNGISEHRYSGTGDILASILCGGLVRGMEAKQALTLATHFLEVAIAESELDKTDPAEGVAFEHHLKLLMEGII